MGSQCSEQGLVTRKWRNEKIAWLAQVSCSWSFIVWILWHTFMTFHCSMKIFFKSDFTVSVLKSFSNNVASKTIYWKRKMLILIQHDWSIRNPYLQPDLYQNPSSFVMNHKLLAFLLLAVFFCSNNAWSMSIQQHLWEHSCIVVLFPVSVSCASKFSICDSAF